MSRLITWISIVAIMLATLMAIALPGTSLAQGNDSLAGHPIVGTWLIAEAETPDDPFIGAFTSDGIYMQVQGKVVGIGVWESTGPNTASMSFTSVIDEEYASGALTIRVALEISEDGMSATGTFTAQLISADGEDYGELGPGSVTATRMTVEPMGTPVGPLSEEEAATPAP